jgi:hypothetical protein
MNRENERCSVKNLVFFFLFGFNFHKIMITMSSPVFSYVLCLDFTCCVEKVIQFLNHPVVSLFPTRMRLNLESRKHVSHTLGYTTKRRSTREKSTSVMDKRTIQTRW